MAANDKGSGPQIGQVVLYNNGGTITAAIIISIAAAGTIGLVYFTSGGPATATSGINYSVGAGTTSTWGYMPFF